MAQAFSGRLYTYAYTDATATVTEDDSEVHAFGRNAAGVTTALSSTGGVSWRLTLDAANRVTTLALRERTTSYTYNSGGRVATVTVADAIAGNTSMRSHTHDDRGRLAGVGGGGRTVTLTYAEGRVHMADQDEMLEYDLDREGRIASVQQGTDLTIWAERDSAGDIVALSQGHRTVQFGRDALGRIVDANFADGQSARYFYDNLGNRTLAEHGDGSSVVYTHDAAGSIVGIETTGFDGAIRRPTVTLDTAGPVLRIANDGRTTLGVEFGRTEHGPLGAIAEVTLKLSPDELLGAGRKLPEPPSKDSRLAVLMADRGPDRQPDYGVVGFDERFRAADLDPLNQGVAYLRDARKLLEVASTLLGNAPADEFDTLSNPVFQSAELRHDEFLRVATQRASGTACTPECEPGDPPVYDPIEVGPVTEATMMPAGVWGSYDISLNVDSLDCRQICPDAVYRIVGKVKTGRNHGLFRSDVWPTGRCTAGERAPDNIARTSGHERHHLTQLVSVINQWQNTRRDYASMDACENGLEVYERALSRAFTDESEKQRCHRDEYFRNSLVHGAQCSCSSDESIECSSSSTEVATEGTQYGNCGEL